MSRLLDLFYFWYLPEVPLPIKSTNLESEIHENLSWSVRYNWIYTQTPIYHNISLMHTPDIHSNRWPHWIITLVQPELLSSELPSLVSNKSSKDVPVPSFNPRTLRRKNYRARSNTSQMCNKGQGHNLLQMKRFVTNISSLLETLSRSFVFAYILGI